MEYELISANFSMVFPFVNGNGLRLEEKVRKLRKKAFTSSIYSYTTVVKKEPLLWYCIILGKAT